MKITSKSLFLSISVLTGWLALILQVCITIQESQLPLWQTLGIYFSYFTILTNIMATVAFSFLLFSAKSTWGIFFGQNRVFAAITIYMVVVAAIYNILLRPITHPTGLGKLTNEMMHVMMPLLSLAYWIIFVKKEELEWNLIWSWLIYPFLYVCMILVTGNFSSHYPYPFINVAKLGYQQVLLNSVGVALLFASLCLVMIRLSKIRAKARKDTSRQ